MKMFTTKRTTSTFSSIYASGVFLLERGVMKKKTITVIMTFTLLALFSGSSIAAEGWTSFGTISDIQGNEDGFAVKIAVTKNPSICNKMTFYFSGDATKGNRYFATLLTAFAAEKQVRILVTDTCNTYGKGLIKQVNIK